MKQQLSVIALLIGFALPLGALAESSLPNQSGEWASVKQIMTIMGKGSLSPADQNSMLEILNAKDAVELSKPVSSSFPATPIKPSAVKRLPPRRSPSTF
jgi:hypothetical protein